MALFVVWATSQAGYPVTHWAPGGLIVLALLGLTLGAVGLDVRAVPLPVKIAVGCLAGYTALSFASILWAAVPGDAWEGANRTLLYLLVFALFALWPQRGRSAALLLGAWTLAMIVLAAFVALHVNAAAGNPARLAVLLPGGRLVYPSGYANANAAQWLMAFWPALLLAREARLHWSVRGLLAGGAVLLAGVALLSVSRGSLYATPVMLVLVFALLPGRVRTFARARAGRGRDRRLRAVGAARRGTSRRRPECRGGDAHGHYGDVARGAGGGARGRAGRGARAAAIFLGEHRRARAPRRRGSRGPGARRDPRRWRGGGGQPRAPIEHGWHTFKVGYSANSKGGNRLVSGLGSNRYDFYRVALDEFLHHPLVGIGADNFQQQYLAHGRSEETPHYPHSVELRTLAQTGLIGALLALVGLGAALLAAARGLRGADQLGRAVVAAALAGFAYWVVHGSFDWFWEFAGLGAPAFALLGLACGLAPRSGPTRLRPSSRPGRRPAPADDRRLASARRCWRRCRSRLRG